MTRHAPHAAFVFSGGASLGAIQVGMLRALYEQAITPDLIVGTSAGALNGAFIASRPQTVATADALAAVWRDLRRGQVFPLNPDCSASSAWRLDRLLAVGFAPPLARRLAEDGNVDLHAVLQLIDRGCPPELAARILAPLDADPPRPS